MKKLILLLSFLFLICVNSSAMSPAFLDAMSGKGAAFVPTDYSALSSCKGYWRMTGTGTESDVSTVGSNDDLTEYPAFYLFPDECTGSDAPEIGCTGSGTASGYIPTGWAAGTKGRHADLSTDSLYHTDGGSTDISGAVGLTICVWYRPDTDPGADEYLVEKSTTASSQRQYQFLFDNDTNRVYFAISNGGGTLDGVYSDTDPHADTNPHLFCGVYDRTDLRIYLDGALDSTPVSETGDIFNGSDDFTVGSYQTSGGLGARGVFIELGIWNAGLSATDILNIFNYGIDGSKGAND